jgi:decaprenylphospho-beta-D-erythro-pentofuranosid-2-ulose 2-reductase
MSMQYKKVMVLGAASAIAVQTNRLLATEGCDFYLAGRPEEKLAVIADDLLARGAASAKWQSLDFSQSGNSQDLAERAVAAMGGVDLVLAAYGTLGDQAKGERDGSLARKELDTNFSSVVEHLTPLAAHMERQGSGCLAVVSSVAGDRGRASNYIYGAAKGGLSIFLEGLRFRLSPKGVRVLTIKPGFVDTPMTAHIDKSGPLWAGPDKVAQDIVKAIQAGKEEIYTPWFWRWIMLIIRLLPGFVMKRLSI